MHLLKLGAVCFAEYENDYPAFIELAHRIGLCWVEIKYEDPVSARKESSKTDKIRKKAEEYGIGLSVHTRFSGFNMGSLNDTEREESIKAIEESLKFAGEVGAEYATVHAGFLPVEEYSEKNLNGSFSRSINGIERLLRTSDKLGITLCIENGNGFTASKIKHAVIPSALERIRKELNNRIFFTIDFGHGLYFGSDPSYLVDELGPDNVKLSHLHDNMGYKDTHQPLGTGIIKLENLFAKYIEGKWNFPLSLEHKSTKDLLQSVEYAEALAEKMGYTLCRKL
ncbi:MAG: sugar phosphate isomerase/epimerase [Spirochaetales bacterium]|nr:sugar phosphate isomerase/epimerase [Spirochaetales bacterium]